MCRERGQAVVILLAFTACLLGAFLLVINVGQTVNEKLRLTNAADAAAYSAALWEARSLNFQAYTNRAIVANEVAIAQFVSLRSWSGYLDRTLANAALVTTWIPPVGRVLHALERSWKAVDKTLQTSLPPAEAAISRWNVDALAVVQGVAHQQAPVSAAEVVAQVVRESEPRAEVTETTRVFQVRNAEAWQRLTSRYRRGSGELTRYRKLLMESRDGFTADRRADLLPGNPFVSLARRGGTDLLGEYSWRGIDTMSLHVDAILDDAEVPVGWGAAENRRLAVAQRGAHGGSRSTNPRATRLAQGLLVPRSSYLGVPEIRDIQQPQRQQELAVTYAVELRLPRAALATADRILDNPAIALPDGRQLDVAPNLAASALHAAAAAEAYFRRPQPRADGRREYASLFSPYWQARLVAMPAADRAIAAAAKGFADPYAVLP